MHVTIYNGLPPGCHLSNVQLANSKFEENIDFNFTALEEDEFFIFKVIDQNEEAYSIPSFEVQCNFGAKGTKNIKFDSPAEDNEYNPLFKYEEDIITEDDEEIPKGVSILLTYDIDQWDEPNGVPGIVFYGDDRPPLLKSSDSYPDAK